MMMGSPRLSLYKMTYPLVFRGDGRVGVILCSVSHEVATTRPAGTGSG